MGLLGMIGDVASGAAQRGADIMQSQRELSQKEDLARVQGDIEKTRQEALISFKIDAEHAEAQRKAAGVQDVAQGMINQKVGSEFAPSDAAAADAAAGNTVAPLTDEQNASIAQAKAQRGDALANDPMTMLNAEAKYTGDYSKVATLQTQGEIASAKNETFQAKIDAQVQHYADLADKYKDDTATKLQIAQLQATLKGIGGEGKASPKMQLITYMENHPEVYTTEDIRGVATDRPAISPTDIAARIYENNPTIKPEAAKSIANSVVELAQTISAHKSAAASPTAAPAANTKLDSLFPPKK